MLMVSQLTVDIRTDNQVKFGVGRDKLLILVEITPLVTCNFLSDSGDYIIFT